MVFGIQCTPLSSGGLMMTFEDYKRKFFGLYNEAKRLHNESPYRHTGHGVDHNVTVGMLAVLIAPNHRTGEKAFCAALLHSLDRISDQKESQTPKERFYGLATLCLGKLPNSLFTFGEQYEIMEAAIRHAELNQYDQSLTQQVLMDADRLANLMPAVVMRAGQFRHNIAALEFWCLDGKCNHLSTYANPQSVVDALRLNISEYIPQLRLPKAIELAQRYVRLLEQYLSWVEESNDEIGLKGAGL